MPPMKEFSVYEILNRKRRGGPLEPHEVETFIEQGTHRGVVACHEDTMLRHATLEQRLVRHPEKLLALGHGHGVMAARSEA